MGKERIESRLIRKVARRFNVPESHCRIDGDIGQWVFGDRLYLCAQVAVRDQGSTQALIDPQKQD